MCVCPEGTLVSTIFQFLETCVLQNHEKSSSGKQKNLGKNDRKIFLCMFFLPCVFEAC